MSNKRTAANVIPLPPSSRWDRAKHRIEREDEAARPFRLWLPNGERAGSFARWRYYSHLRNAHLGALIECRWSQVGTTIEVVDIRDHKQWGSYTRRMDEIRFLGGDNIPKEME